MQGVQLSAWTADTHDEDVLSQSHGIYTSVQSLQRFTQLQAFGPKLCIQQGPKYNLHLWMAHSHFAKRYETTTPANVWRNSNTTYRTSFNDFGMINSPFCLNSSLLTTEETNTDLYIFNLFSLKLFSSSATILLELKTSTIITISIVIKLPTQGI